MCHSQCIDVGWRWNRRKGSEWVRRRWPEKERSLVFDQDENQYWIKRVYWRNADYSARRLNISCPCGEEEEASLIKHYQKVEKLRLRIPRWSGSLLINFWPLGISLALIFSRLIFDFDPTLPGGCFLLCNCGTEMVGEGRQKEYSM